MSVLSALPLSGQIINLLAAVLLLISFAMLVQRRILSLIDRKSTRLNSSH